MQFVLIEVFLSMLAGTLLAVAAYYLLETRKGQSAFVGSAPDPLPTFLFDDRKLLDASNGAMRLLDGRPDDIPEWDTLILALSNCFQGFEDTLETLADGATATCISDINPDMSVELERFGSKVRIGIKGDDPTKTPDVLLSLTHQSERTRFEALSNIADSAPQLIWKEDRDGKVVWCNKTYLRYCDKAASSEPAKVPLWPAKRLFGDLVPPDRISHVAAKTRHSLRLAEEEAEHWFSISSLPVPDGTLNFATSANDEVRAERVYRDFMQTFAKTFAQLSIGLAIFDRSHRLTMFNPSLIEMTGLSSPFLSARPTIHAVLDHLRESRKLPEPKNYTEWRSQFVEMLDADKSETYLQTWNLPDGQTLRVTGRPYPDGAFAFLFEDISAEMTLTRRFRAELQTSQAVIDTIPNAIAVFSASNTLVASNKAYADLWNTSGEAVINSDLRSAIDTWKSGAAPTTFWSNIENLAAGADDKTDLSSQILLRNGRVISCSAKSIGGGMTMVTFLTGQEMPEEQKPMPKVQESLRIKA